MNRTIGEVQSIRDLCAKLPRKNKNVFQAWYWAHGGSEMICVQQRLAEPKYLNITAIPTEEIESRVKRFLEE